ncbi:MAG TPA: hypothetical protein VK427_03360 [Kofleriaceae bacterium]|nr:hypothetical protein [Kofleriaceae bacterium]
MKGGLQGGLHHHVSKRVDAYALLEISVGLRSRFTLGRNVRLDPEPHSKNEVRVEVDVPPE